MQDVVDSATWARLGEVARIRIPRYNVLLCWLVVLALALLLAALVYVPWVQTAFGTGKTTALDPTDRMQTINALAGGRIKKWFVEDGDSVNKGDPIVEIVDLDPQLVERLQAEREAIRAKYEAARIATSTARLNYERQQRLLDQGLTARSEFELAKIKYQEMQGTEQAALAELNSVDVRLSRQSSLLVTAPRDGRILQITAGDSATLVSSGEPLASFAPRDAGIAVEMFITGLDASLVQPGNKVRLMFEGWPAVQFGGWPSVAIGTFGGIVSSIDPAVSPNGRFRVLVVEDPDDPWPARNYLRYGAQVKGWILLSEVRLGYELWRRLNSFPPLNPQAQGTSPSAPGQP